MPAATAADVDARALIERLPAVTYVSDAGVHGRWHYVSPQIEHMLGFTCEEWLADPELWAHLIHPDDRDQQYAHEAAAEATGGALSVAADEYRMCRRDGRIIWVRDDAVLVEDSPGRLRWHGVLTDISDRKHAEAERERQAAQQAAVAGLGERALAGASLSELMQQAVTDAAEILRTQYGAVLAKTAAPETLLLRAGFGCHPESIDALTVPAGARTQCGVTLASGRAVIVNDWFTEERYERSAVLNPPGSHSGLTVAINGADGPWGVLGVQSTVPREFTASDADFVQSLANILADAVRRRATEDEIRHQALHDPLTGLPNRVLFIDRVSHALARRGSHVAVLFVDIDQFKIVNDSMGHGAGDALLIDIGPRLREALRPSDTIARFGGDGFAILLEDVSGERTATAVAERISAAFARPFLVAGTEHFATLSIGIALGGGEDSDPEALVRDADAAMYRAKERGRRRYELFDSGMRARAIERFSIENDLRRALEREELRVAYQPLLSMNDGSIMGVEALARWKHPERGPIPPGEFIPVAEECGLIDAIGAWVLEHACRQAVRWNECAPDRRPLTVAVNLSARQIMRTDIAKLVSSTLRRTGLDASCLAIEITESVLIDEPDTAASALGALTDLGLRVALDDFGTGYSSLSYLARLPIDMLKLDRSFVGGLGDEAHETAIATAVLSMAQALSLDVVAEGVETERQHEELAQLGCAFAQGFLFSRPVWADEISAMLASGTPWCGVPIAD